MGGVGDGNDELVSILREAVVKGLDDDWTQVRYSASIAARALLLKFHGTSPVHFIILVHSFIVYTYIYIHIHTYTYICIHTYKK